MSKTELITDLPEVVPSDDRSRELSSPPLLGIASSGTPRGQRLTVVGEVDMETAPQMESALRAAIVLGNVELDLTGVSFMDSTGLTVMIHASNDAPDGRRIEIVAASPQVERLIKIVGVGELFGCAGVRTGPSPTAGGRRDQLLVLLADVARAVPGCHSASVTLFDGPQTYTAGYSHHVAFELDEGQYIDDSGPCLTAIRSGQSVRIAKIVSGPGRYESFRATAFAAGIRSSLSVPFGTTTRRKGSLNLYSESVETFLDDDERTAEEFAARVGVLLSDPV